MNTRVCLDILLRVDDGMSAGVNNIVGCRDVLLFADNMKFAGVLRSEGEV